LSPRPRPSPAARADLLRRLEEAKALRREWLRRQILERDRIDLLASEVLGYEVRPHHLDLLQHQHRFPDRNLALAWRGAGKTTVRTVCRAIFLLLKNPNARILLASKSSLNAAAMLAEIKGRLTSPAFEEVFGVWQGPKWDDIAIQVRPRTSGAKEPSVGVVGAESSIVSLHWDALLVDDLVDEENARTPTLRNRLQTLFYKALLPTLVPGGELSLCGTRYHHLDLYGHLAENEMAGPRTLVVPGLRGSDEQGWEAVWPERFSVEHLLALRRSMGSILWDSQYLCSTRKMAGGGFVDFEWCQRVAATEVPADAPRFLGADLAISMAPGADRFAVVVEAWDSTSDRRWVVDGYAGRRPPHEQRRIIADHYRRHRCVRGCIESNAYQAALISDLRREQPDLVLVPSHTGAAKEARMLALAAAHEDLRVFYAEGLDWLVEEMVLFPTGAHDDGFDALDLAHRATRYRQRKARREVGLL
jgi:predicted phage terminase large subunit-like protein